MVGAGAGSHESVSGLFARLSWLTVVTWSCYPLVWIFAEGFGILSVTMAAIFYCVLDISAKVVFGYILLSAQEALERTTSVYGYKTVRDAPPEHYGNTETVA